MKRNTAIKTLILSFISVACAIIVVAAMQIGLIVRANPQECPPGQEKKNGCVWVQGPSGKCQWKPLQAVAPPWVPVFPEGVCPVLVLPSNTPFQPLVTWTPVPRPTDTRWPTLTSTAAATIVPTQAKTLISATKTSVLPTPNVFTCVEDCDPLWALAHAQQTQAAVQATELIWKMTEQAKP